MKRPLPIEPLDEASWQRIEDRAVAEASLRPVAPHEPGRWRHVAVAALAVASLALAVGLWPREAPPEPPTTTRIATDAAPSTMRLGELTLDVAAHSELVAVGSDARGWELDLARGAVTCTVPPRVGRPALVLRAGSIRVEVIGTRFTVERDPVLAVRVARGMVRVIEPERAHVLRAGDVWPRPPRGEARPTPPALTEDDATERHDPGVTEPSVTEPSVTEPSVTEPSVTEPGADPQAAFQRASSLEARDPARADAIYAGVQRAGGPWAANALFARGRLAADRGQLESARRFLRRYLRDHPDHLNAADARRLLSDMETP